MWPEIPKLVSSVAKGERTAESLVGDSLKRIEESREFNVTLAIDDKALDKAKELDASIAKGDVNKPLLGVPFVAKDNFLTVDTKTTAASRFLTDYKSPYSSTAIEKLEAAGAIMVAKTNMDEFAQGSSTENSAFGPTKNPHDKTLVPGGSSGGSAAAVALSLAPFALGTDTGGSIRQPASYCGVVGYKPTYGLVSRYGVIAMASSCDVVGPFSSSVADSAVVLDVLAGPDNRDSTTIDRTESYLLPDTGELEGVKVGVIRDHMGEEVDPVVRSSVEVAIDRIKAAGAVVEMVDLPMQRQALGVYYIIVPAEISSNLARYDGVKYGESDKTAANLLDTYLASRGKGFGEEVIRRIITGTFVLSSGYQDAYYKQAQRVRTLISAEYVKAFDNFDVLLGPTAPTPAFELGSKPDPLTMYMSDNMTIAANLAGVPAVSLPLECSDLPIGLQLQAAQREDAKLLSIAAAVERLV